MSATRKSIVKKRGTNLFENVPPHILELLKDPKKRQIVLDVISTHTNPINHPPRTPKEKVIQAIRCESPVELFRRRALEQQNSPKTPKQPKTPIENIPLTPKNTILKNVFVYVDVEKNGQDQTKKYQDIVRSLGGTVKDAITHKVTHVVFKAGSYVTYDRARLVNAHLISLKWLTDCVKNNKRMNERLYPAFGANRHDSTTDIDSSPSPNKAANCKRTPANSTSASTSMSTLHLSVDKPQSNKNGTNTSRNTSSTLPTMDRKSSGAGSKRSKGSFNSSKSPFSPLEDTRMCGILNKLSDKDPAPFVTVRKKSSKEQSTDDEKDVQQPPKKIIRRKLYNPDESISLDYSSQDEREERRRQKTKSSSDEERKVPEIVHTAINKICGNLDDKARKDCSSDDSEIADVRIDAKDVLELALKQKKNKRKEKERLSVDDEQKELAAIFVRNSPPVNGNLAKGISQSEKIVNTRKSIRRDVLKQNALTFTSSDTDNSPEKSPLQSKKGKGVIKVRKSMANVKINDYSNKEVKKSSGKRTTRKASVQFESSDSESNVSPKKTSKKTSPPPVERVNLRRSMRISSTQEKKMAEDLSDSESSSECSPKKPERVAVRRRSVRLLEKQDNAMLRTLNTPKPSQRRKTIQSQSEKKVPQRCHKSESDELSPPSISGRKRRSTLDFVAISSYKTIKIRKLYNNKASNIVITKMHRSDIDRFEETVKKLGRFVIENAVNKKTTHLVVGDSCRTLNLLRAMVLGCWILKKEWYIDSDQAGKWLPEEKYEVIDLYPAIQTCRMQRQAFGSYSMDIFRNCGSFYIDHFAHPPLNELKLLISWCHGKVVNQARRADIIVGKFVDQDSCVCVHPNWVLDSISQNKKLPYEKYLLKRTNRYSEAV